MWSGLLTQLQQEFHQLFLRYQYPFTQSKECDVRRTSILFDEICDVIDNGFFEGNALLIQFYEYMLHWNGKCANSERMLLASFAENGVMALFNRVESSRVSVLNTIVSDVHVHASNEP